MDPYNNQGGVGQQPGQQPEPIVSQDAQGWPTHAQDIPDWQRGLGRPAPTVYTGNTDPYAMQLPNVDQQENQFPQMPPAMQEQPLSRPQPAPLTPQEVPTTTERTFESPEEKKRRSLAALFTIGIIVILLLAAVAVFFITKHNSNKDKQSGSTTLNSPTPNAKGGDLGSLTSLDFGVPTNLNPYTGDTSTTAGYHIYLTQGSSDAKGCSLSFGLMPEDQLPGKDSTTVINTQIESLRAHGAAITGPTKGATLKLKSGDGKTVYNLPTTNYQYVSSNKYVSGHYSVAVLKGGQRAVVFRECANTGGAPDGNSLDKIEDSAKELTINPAKQ